MVWIVERQTELIEFGLVKLEEVVFILRVLVDRLWTNLAQVVLIDAVLSCRSFAAFLARRPVSSSPSFTLLWYVEPFGDKARTGSKTAICA